ncbi:MAG: hypothetical protein C7B46_12785 [Sulfobacillus benefaciens]|uniref:Transposase IS4-like domain-containing protein n=1 Tax=Sulfobacillus benefaciens TaxID=453960 RepID=A0A2T2XEC2_9FIRM|nr:MAG: hypothetical protein C7B46_12785 [Sulfobacillus benefaciens]
MRSSRPSPSACPSLASAWRLIVKRWHRLRNTDPPKRRQTGVATRTPTGARRPTAALAGKEKRGKRSSPGLDIKIHLLVDATYELPVAWTVTKASTADITEAPTLLRQLHEKHPLAWQSARVLSADRGYDATALIENLWDDYWIKPIIDIRNLWKDGEATRLLLLSPLSPMDNTKPRRV